MRYCVTGDTLINTEKGLRRIDSLVPHTKPNSDNPINIRVKSVNGANNSSDMLFNSGYRRCYQIVLKNGMAIKVSDNHPILVVPSVDDKRMDNRPHWVLAKNLRIGMRAIIDANPDNAMFGNNDNLAQAMEYAAEFRKNKKDYEIPEDVLQGTKMYLLTYIKALFGEENKLITKSEVFARQIQTLLATQLGFLSSKFYNEDTHIFVVKIDKKNRKYNYVPIKHVYPLKEKEIVYSVRVKSKCHSFTANAFINHNTEARLSTISEDTLLSDLENNTVEFVPNYDDTETEPVVLPAKIPNLLISGSEGIAVGMACSIPSHNLGEVIEATQLMLTKKNVKLEELLDIIKGPDFATGGIVSNARDLPDIYRTGKGRIRIRGKTEIYEEGGRPYIKITEIPATMIGALDKFIMDVCTLIRDKKAPDIMDISNLSGKDGIEIIVELRKGASPEKNLNILFKKAKLEDTFSFNLLAVNNNQPKVFSLMEYLQTVIDFQVETNTKKYQHLLEKKKREREIKEGLVRAIDCIDLIIEILRGSKSRKDAMDCMMNGVTGSIKFKTKKSENEAKKLNFTELQTTEILAMPLQRLIGLELEALMKDLDKCNKLIAEYEGYLSSPVKLKNRIKNDLEEIKVKYGIPRKTQISDEKEIVIEKEEVVEQDYYLLIDRFRYAKLIDEATFQRNQESIPNDYKYCIQIKNTDKLCIFAENGKMHSIKAIDIPTGKYKDKGTPLENLSNLQSADNIVFLDSLANISSQKLLFVNSKGFAKIVDGNEFIATTKTIAATKLADDATLMFVTYPILDELLLSTKNGFYIRFKTAEISEMKKTANGVRCIKLKDDDAITNCFVGDSNSNFVVNKTEYPFSRIKLSKRDGVGTKSKL